MSPKTSGISIQAVELSKAYSLYRSQRDRLKEAFHPRRKQFHTVFHALSDINLEIQRGETVGIIGVNGSGKSTLLKLISGILTPSGGTIRVSGRVSALLELGAGFNPQMNGIENVYLTGTIMGFSREQTREKLGEIIDFAEIGDHIHQPVKSYSSGMYVRLAFAVATSIDPDILLVDEALSVGDMYFQSKSMQRMKSLMEQGCTTLFVSHDTSAVKTLCSRCIYLEQGRVKMSGETGEVIDRYISDQIERSGSFGTSKNQAAQSKSELVPLGRSFGKENLEAFQRNARLGRHGEQSVEVVFAGLYNERGELSGEIQFGGSMWLKIFYRSRSSLDQIVVAFYIRDKNLLEVIGSNNVNENKPTSRIEAGRVYCTEFEIRNYLKEGNYSIQILLAKSTGRTDYYDWIESAVLFRSVNPPGLKRWAAYNPPLRCEHSRIEDGLTGKLQDSGE